MYGMFIRLAETVGRKGGLIMAKKQKIDRLAIDAAAAHAAGLSYGKWRMQQDKIKQQKKAKRAAQKKSEDTA